MRLVFAPVGRRRPYVHRSRIGPDCVLARSRTPQGRRRALSGRRTGSSTGAPLRIRGRRSSREARLPPSLPASEACTRPCHPATRRWPERGSPRPTPCMLTEPDRTTRYVSILRTATAATNGFPARGPAGDPTIEPALSRSGPGFASRYEYRAPARSSGAVSSASTSPSNSPPSLSPGPTRSALTTPKPKAAAPSSRFLGIENVSTPFDVGPVTPVCGPNGSRPPRCSRSTSTVLVPLR